MEYMGKGNTMTASLDEAKHIHLIGIGGCSMSGIARILKAQGHEVTGSDRAQTQFTERVEQDGITVFYGHKAEQANGADLIVYSAAIKPDNPERAYGREHGIPELERSVALGQLSARFRHVVAVAGCHGKTTITSMLALIAERGGVDATVHVGGFMDLLGGGVRLGHSDLFITEACEYVESFLTLKPTVAIINNIDNDHLDYYGDIEHIIDAFRRFIALVPETGKVLCCTDDAYVRDLLPELGGNVETYGLTAGDYHAGTIEYDALGSPSFDLYDHGEKIGRVQLNVPGRHNIINAIATWASAKQYGVDFGHYAEAMERFRNTSRRFELLGEKNGVKIFHDYGHHPNEIKETLAAATHVPHGKIFCVFQCNSYTRARTLFCENVTCFADADEVLVPDIYPGREIDTGVVHARDMVAGINRETHNATYLGTFENIAAYLDAHAVPGDIVITVGSGDVYRQSQKLL